MKKNLKGTELKTFKGLEDFLKENKDYAGTLISVIEIVKEVWKKEKKASVLIHFYLERLNKLERRQMLKFLTLFQDLLLSQNEDKSLNESKNLDEEAFKQLFPAGSFQEKLLRGKL